MEANQPGKNGAHTTDVQQQNVDRIKHLMNTYGAFDLIVRGGPCNKLPGSNRNRHCGPKSKEFFPSYDYCCILNLVEKSVARSR